MALPAIATVSAIKFATSFPEPVVVTHPPPSRQAARKANVRPQPAANHGSSQELKDFTKAKNSASSSTKMVTKKCRRCEKFFSSELFSSAKAKSIDLDSDKAVCFVHTGKYRATYQAKMAMGTYSQWSCCKNPDEAAPPCRAYMSHVECKQTTSTMALVDTLHKEANYTPPEDPEENEPEPEEPVDDSDDSMYRDRISDHAEHDKVIIHPVLMDDTLAGVSLKYDVPAHIIKKVNKLKVDADLFTRLNIIIPYKGQKLHVPSEKEQELMKARQQRQAIRSFRRKTGDKFMRDEEALFYLNDAGFEMDKAMELYNADMEWEKTKAKKN